jgi:hypothetical protein
MSKEWAPNLFSLLHLAVQLHQMDPQLSCTERFLKTSTFCIEFQFSNNLDHEAETSEVSYVKKCTKVAKISFHCSSSEYYKYTPISDSGEN